MPSSPESPPPNAPDTVSIEERKHRALGMICHQHRCGAGVGEGEVEPVLGDNAVQPAIGPQHDA